MKEKNQAAKLCKNYRKAIVAQPMPNINQLHSNLQQFYLDAASEHSQKIASVISASAESPEAKLVDQPAANQVLA